MIGRYNSFDGLRAIGAFGRYRHDALYGKYEEG